MLNLKSLLFFFSFVCSLSPHHLGRGGRTPGPKHSHVRPVCNVCLSGGKVIRLINLLVKEVCAYPKGKSIVWPVPTF